MEQGFFSVILYFIQMYFKILINNKYIDLFLITFHQFYPKMIKVIFHFFQ